MIKSKNFIVIKMKKKRAFTNNSGTLLTFLNQSSKFGEKYFVRKAVIDGDRT